MKLEFLGDSITEGTGASDENLCYVSRVKEFLNADVINYGIGGTRFAKRKGQYKTHRYEIYFDLRVELMDDDADMVFVFGGTNDYGHGNAPIGNIDDNTVWTFCGAINILCDHLIKKFGKEKINFIIPCKRFNYLNKAQFVDGNLLDFVNAMKSILDKKGIPYIDLWNMFDEPLTDAYSEYFSDGLHPNDNGHNKIANIICDYIKNKTK